MNRKKYEAPLHGRAKKKFDDDDSDEDEEIKEDKRSSSVRTSMGRKARSTGEDKDDAQYIDGKDFLNMIQKKKTVKKEDVLEEKRPGRRFQRDKPTRKKDVVNYFSNESENEEKESIIRSQIKDNSSTEEMLSKKAITDAKFKRLLTKKNADGDKRYRD